MINQMLEIAIRQFLDGLIFGSFLGLLAMGFALITLTMKSINFAYGDLCIMGAVISFLLAPILSSYWTAIIIASLISGAVGLVIGLLIAHCQAQPHGKIYIYPLALAYGFFLIFREVESVVMAGAIYKPDAPIAGSLYIGLLNMFYPTYRIFILVLTFVLFISLWLIFTKTKVGLLIRAAIDDSELLSCLGVKVASIIVLTFVISSCLSAIASGLTSPIIGFHEESGFDILLWCLFIVFFGGVGSIMGSFLSGILLGEVYSFSVLWLDPRLAEFTVFALVIVVILLRPRGLLGKRLYEIT